MSGWDALDAELNRWTAVPATFWWRDDDAQQPTAALSALLELSHSRSVPLGLAVVPSKSADALAAALASSAMVQVLQHGYAHANHAPPEEKKAEYGDHRPAEVMSGEIADGAARLAGQFGDRFLPLLVPPWNRISVKLLPSLPPAGIQGLSTFAPRESGVPAAGLKQVNTHVDLIDWKCGRSFKGTARIVREMAAHLAARRMSRVDAGEPTGILSHHLVHDEACWTFLRRLFSHLDS